MPAQEEGFNRYIPFRERPRASPAPKTPEVHSHKTPFGRAPTAPRPVEAKAPGPREAVPITGAPPGTPPYRPPRLIPPRTLFPLAVPKRPLQKYDPDHVLAYLRALLKQMRPMLIEELGRNGRNAREGILTFTHKKLEVSMSCDKYFYLQPSDWDNGPTKYLIEEEWDRLHRYPPFVCTLTVTNFNLRRPRKIKMVLDSPYLMSWFNIKEITEYDWLSFSRFDWSDGWSEVLGSSDPALLSESMAFVEKCQFLSVNDNTLSTLVAQLDHWLVLWNRTEAVMGDVSFEAIMDTRRLKLIIKEYTGELTELEKMDLQKRRRGGGPSMHLG